MAGFGQTVSVRRTVVRTRGGVVVTESVPVGGSFDITFNVSVFSFRGNLNFVLFLAHDVFLTQNRNFDFGGVFVALIFHTSLVGEAVGVDSGVDDVGVEASAFFSVGHSGILIVGSGIVGIGAVKVADFFRNVAFVSEGVSITILSNGRVVEVALSGSCVEFSVFVGVTFVQEVASLSLSPADFVNILVSGGVPTGVF